MFSLRTEHLWKENTLYQNNFFLFYVKSRIACSFCFFSLNGVKSALVINDTGVCSWITCSASQTHISAINQTLVFLWCPVSNQGQNNGLCPASATSPFPGNPPSVHCSSEQMVLERERAMTQNCYSECTAFLDSDIATIRPKEVEDNAISFAADDKILYFSTPLRFLYFYIPAFCYFLLLFQSISERSTVRFATLPLYDRWI